MSLSIAHGPLFSTAPLPAPFIFRRQFQLDDSSDDNVKCTPKDKKAEHLDCPKITDALQNCATGGVPADEVTEDTPVYADKAKCVDYCNMIISGDAVKWSLQCLEDQCTDADEYEDGNEKLIKDSFEELYMPICKQLGLEKVTKESDVEDSKDEAEGDEKEKDKDSAAGLVKGWKSASVVAALVFGSLFSGLML
jgi:hypothetical protein